MACVILKDKIMQDVLIDNQLKVVDVKSVRLYNELMKGYTYILGAKTKVYKLLGSTCWTTFNPLGDSNA